MIAGIFLRHFKIYKGARYIPFGLKNVENFNLFIGQNGAGKSSILESLDTFFNNKDFILHLGEKKSEGFVAPLFLIDKAEKFDQEVKQLLPFISEFFFTLSQSGSTNYSVYSDFFAQRPSLLKFKDTHYLAVVGQWALQDHSHNICITFHSALVKYLSDPTISQQHSVIISRIPVVLSKLKQSLIDKYSYQYIPVETSINDFL